MNAPELPSCLQGIIGADPKPGRWILTGSQNLALLESVSQSLAGRSSVLHLSASLFDGTRRVRDHLTRPSRPCDVVIAYGGDEAQTRSDAKLVPWTRLHEQNWTR